MKLNLEPVDQVREITKADFIKYYFKPQKPLIIKEQITGWPAYNKWNFSYIKSLAGEKIVPLYDDRPVDYRDGFNEPHARMKMSDYIELLQKEPTKFRIFLWNILKEVPELQSDFSYPDLGLKLMKSLPMMFFGGKDSYTFMHYDIDLANIFHFHFEGKKQCILYPQSENKFLYKIPHSLITREDIDFNDPDLDKWPALKKARGYIADLVHGNILYMPEGYWHYMRYISPGFSMSLRAIARNPKNISKAVYNVLIMRNFDNLMRKIKGQRWIEWKNKQAILNTNHEIALKG